MFRRRASNTLKGSSIPVRDESGRFAGTRLQTEQERRQARFGLCFQIKFELN